MLKDLEPIRLTSSAKQSVCGLKRTFKVQAVLKPALTFPWGLLRSPQHVPYFPNQHKMYGELIWHIYNSLISRSPHHSFGLNLNQDSSLRLSKLRCSTLPPFIFIQRATFIGNATGFSLMLQIKSGFPGSPALIKPPF